MGRGEYTRKACKGARSAKLAKSLRFFLLLFWFRYALTKLLHRRDIWRTQGVFRRIAPHGRRVERILDTASVDFECVLGSAYLIADARTRILRPHARIAQRRRMALLGADANTSVTRLHPRRPAVGLTAFAACARQPPRSTANR